MTKTHRNGQHHRGTNTERKREREKERETMRRLWVTRGRANGRGIKRERITKRVLERERVQRE